MIPSLLLLTALAAGPSAGPAAAPVADPARVPWTELRYEASKLLLTARADVELSRGPLPSSDGRRPEGPTPVVLRLGSSVLSKNTVSTLWLDPEDGRTYLQERRERGRSDEARTYRYDGAGATVTTREPGDDAQTNADPSTWTGRSEEERRDFGPRPEGYGVTVPGALLYLAAALPLDAPGDEATFLVYSRQRLMLAKLRAEEWVDLDLRFAEETPAGRNLRQGPLRTLRLSVAANTLDGAATDLKLFGLEGDIGFFLDPERRMPVRISGKMPIVGSIDIELKEVVLNSAR
ncbi:MAG: hypothetical protein AAGD06_15525 [Acidobacteriota bacterium]